MFDYSRGGQGIRCRCTELECTPYTGVSFLTISDTVHMFHPTNISSCHNLAMTTFKTVLLFNSYSLLDCQVAYKTIFT